MPDSKNPLDRLDRQELLWLTGILKDACRERLEKNLVSQAFEERLYRRGPVKGRLDPRPFLRIWEPRYRRFLEVATELHAQLESEEARAAADTLREKFETGTVERQGPGQVRTIGERKRAAAVR
jgi:hypothetical protein